jgi:hypothetical protein
VQKHQDSRQKSGDPAPGRVPLFRRPLVLAPVVALGIAAVWWLVRGPRVVSNDEREAAAGPGPSVSLAEARKTDPEGYVAAVIAGGTDNPQAVGRLMEVYTKWAGAPETTEARRMALKALLKHPNPKVGLESVLTAVHGDQTPREQDPLWQDLVKGVAPLWDKVTFPFGRDALALEERAKAKDLLLESLLAADPNKLGPDQQKMLAADLIDLYPSLRTEQKPAADRALVALAGTTDVVEILTGRGLSGQGANNLQAVVAERNTVDELQRRLKEHPLPPESLGEDEKPAPSKAKPK